MRNILLTDKDATKLHYITKIVDNVTKNRCQFMTTTKNFITGHIYLTYEEK